MYLVRIVLGGRAGRAKECRGIWSMENVTCGMKARAQGSAGDPGKVDEFTGEKLLQYNTRKV